MARSFNGSSDKAQNLGGITQGPQVGNPVNFTIGAWAYIIGAGSGTPCFCAYGKNASGYELQMGWTVTGTKWSVVNFITGTDITTSSSSTYTTATWTHVLQTLSGGANALVITLYINGVSAGSSGPFAGNWGRAQVGDSISFGYDQMDNANFANARVADTAMWNGTVLAQGEITALANGAKPYAIRPQSLTYYWPLDGLQSPEPNFTSNSGNLTLTGTALAPGPPVMMFTPRWPTAVLPTGTPASTVAFRRTLSPLGTRAGSRQVQGQF